MRNSAYILIAFGTLAVGCTFTGGILPAPQGQSITLRMIDNGNGQLEFCDDNGICHLLDNPNGCIELEVEISLNSGRVCETCVTDRGVDFTCDGGVLSCTVVTAPDPDCVVCAKQGGSVVFSTCRADHPSECTYPEPGPNNPATSCGADSDCAPGQVCEAGACVADCRTCYDAGGRPVLTECGTDCSNVACPAVACAPGFVAVTLPGDCCATCAPDVRCEEAVCPMDLSIPVCPPGTQLVRDPGDCCHYLCEATECPPLPGGTSAPFVQCPMGFEWDDSYPTCGQCVPVDDTRYCLDGNDCGANELCTNAIGACLTPPWCDGSTGMVCPSVCYGECAPAQNGCTNATTWVPDGVSYCEGEWVSGGSDPMGCPLPPLCQCADGVVSLDGSCGDQCASTLCGPPPTCGPDEVLITGYPYCCGFCQPVNGTCDPTSGGTNPGFACQPVTCGAGYHTKVGPDCCEYCVRDMEEPCSSSDSCHVGEYCTTYDGVCNPPPGCDPMGGAMGCGQVCYGTCAPESTCEDTDGVDPSVAGHVEFSNRWGADDVLPDRCEDPWTVAERHCYQPVSGSSSREVGVIFYTCAFGCDAGRCLPP